MRTAAVVLSVLAFAALTGCARDEMTTEPAVRGMRLDASPALESGELLAITYNVHEPFERIPQSISEFLREYQEALERQKNIGPLLNDYELAVLQESFVARLKIRLGFFNLNLIFDGLYRAIDERAFHPYRSGYQYPQPPPAPLPTDLDLAFSDGLVRFSQLPFAADELGRAGWSTCHANDCYTNKGFSVARTRLPSVAAASVDVYNLHMNAGSDAGDLEARWQQMQQLSEAINANSSGRAVIVAGDFNLNPYDSDPTRAGRDREILEELLDRTGLQDACTVLSCCDPLPGATNSCYATPQVDRFLFRPSSDGPATVVLEPLTWEARKEGTEFEGLSDHSAIIVRFGWQLFDAGSVAAQGS